MLEQTGFTSVQERNWAMFCHLGTLLGFMIPFANLLAPLILWLMKREEMPFVDDQGKEALNFQITMTIGAVVSIILMFVLIGFLLIFALCIFNIVFVIIATIKANEGVKYRYPFALRFIN